MKFIQKYFGNLFLHQRFYLVTGLCVLFFVFAFIIPFLAPIAFVVFFVFLLMCLIDYSLLFFTRKIVSAQRITAIRFGNGESNKIEIKVKNHFSFSLHVEVIDELPEEFQIRNWRRKMELNPGQQKEIAWYAIPRERGNFYFGNIHLFASSPLNLIVRRFTEEAEHTVPVYPAFMQLHKYELFSDATLSNESGSYRYRKIGAGMEFEQIKDYVAGDDIRTLNWKATARRGNLMVNHFMQERSQQVYCIIDKGRLMKMPFEGLSLLDYAINSSLILSNVCLKKQDRVGIITFSNTPGDILAADRKPTQMERILQILYKQETAFLESDFEMLYRQIRNKIKQRSLLILFTNFETLSGLHRQIDYLRSIAKHHLLVVVIFENTELDKITKVAAKSIEQIYIKTIAEKFAYEKRLIARELLKHGILSILSSPQDLTPAAIKKYLELKTKQAI